MKIFDQLLDSLYELCKLRDEGLHEQMEDLVVNRSGAPATAGAPFFLPEPF